jgi:hypothetical protein
MQIYKTLSLAIVLLCTACGVDLRSESAAGIQELVTMNSDADTPLSLVAAPELQVRHFRLKFYGYDTVYYYLQAVKNSQHPLPVFQLVIDANYGGALRHYDTVRMIDGEVYPTLQRRHDTVRCQIFGNMTDSCLYRDRTRIELSQNVLQSFRHNGLSLILAATGTDYETIDLPANYIDGFLLAVQKSGL